MNVLKGYHAELIKLKYLPIFWLAFTVVFCTTGIIFAAHYFDSESVAKLGQSPWDKLWNAGAGIFGTFMIVPFVVMMVSAAVYVEHQSNTWKYQYTTPVSRSAVFYQKLMALFSLVVFLIVVVLVCLFGVAFILNIIFPEFEFAYYPPDCGSYVSNMLHLLVAILGIIGIQYFMSMRFKGFLIPASVGVIAFVIAFIVSTTNKPYALFYPYSYPMIASDNGMFKTDKIGVESLGIINNVELYSIICFVFFIGLSNILELRKRIT